jgi:hypothetical protein
VLLGYTEPSIVQGREQIMKATKPLFVGLLVFATMAPPLCAHEYTSTLKQYAKGGMAKWVNNKILVQAIKMQNIDNADINEAQITKLDNQWMQEVSSNKGSLTESKLNNPAADYLRKVQTESNGQFAEIFVMDNKGLIVAMSNTTSDYYQGDEKKFTDSFVQGADAVEIGPIVGDESTGIKQVQVSMTISDEGKPIGAITVGVNPKKIPGNN